MQRKKHFDRFRKSGTIKSPPPGGGIFTDTGIVEFSQRPNYPINTRETRAVFLLRKKKRAAFEGSLGVWTEKGPCSVKGENHNADTTHPCVAEKYPSTFFLFSCVHRVVLGLEQEHSLAQCTPNERWKMACLPVFFSEQSSKNFWDLNSTERCGLREPYQCFEENHKNSSKAL